MTGKKRKTNGKVLKQIFVLRLDDGCVARLDELVKLTGENRQTLVRQMIRQSAIVSIHPINKSHIGPKGVLSVAPLAWGAPVKDRK